MGSPNIVTLRFEGYSDDTFGEYGQTNIDYSASGKPIEFLVRQGDEAVVVVGQYCPGNCGGWLVGVASYDPEGNDVPLPSWPMRLVPGERPYTSALEVDVGPQWRLDCLTEADDG